MRHVSVSVMKRQPIGSKGWPTQPSRLVVEVTFLWRSSNRRKRKQQILIKTERMPSLWKINSASKKVFNIQTFFLVFVDVHLSLLLEAERVDDGDGQSQGFSRVAVGPQGVNASARRRYMVYVRWGEGRNEVRSGQLRRVRRRIHIHGAVSAESQCVSDRWLKLQNLTDLSWKAAYCRYWCEYQQNYCVCVKSACVRVYCVTFSKSQECGRKITEVMSFRESIFFNYFSP